MHLRCKNQNDKKGQSSNFDINVAKYMVIEIQCILRFVAKTRFVDRFLCSGQCNKSEDAFSRYMAVNPSKFENMSAKPVGNGQKFLDVFKLTLNNSVTGQLRSWRISKCFAFVKRGSFE